MSGEYLNCKKKDCDGKMNNQGSPFICSDPKYNLPVYKNEFISKEPDGREIKIGRSECLDANLFKCQKCGSEFLNVFNEVIEYFPRRKYFKFYFFRNWPCSSYKLCVSRDEFLKKILPEFNKGKKKE